MKGAIFFYILGLLLAMVNAFHIPSSLKSSEKASKSHLDRADFVRFLGIAEILLLSTSVPIAAVAANPPPSSLEILRQDTRKKLQKAEKKATKEIKTFKKEVKKVEKKTTKEIKTIKKKVNKETKNIKKEVKSIQNDVNKEIKKVDKVVSKETQAFKSKAQDAKLGLQKAKTTTTTTTGINLSNMKVCDGVKVKCVQ